MKGNIVGKRILLGLVMIMSVVIVTSGQDNTLIIQQNRRVIEVDSSGNIVDAYYISYDDIRLPYDLDILDNGNYLVTDAWFTPEGKVAEVNAKGELNWTVGPYDSPRDADRLNNGNTLITEYFGGRVIEVDSSGAIVWQKTGLNNPVDAERLDNGNTLIAETSIGRVIEVDNSGTIVWQMTGLGYPWDVERLGNGNTLITENFGGRVIEVDSSGTIVWQMTGLNNPWDADRLDNGNTLITECRSSGRVIEVDSSNTIVWELTGLTLPVDAERLDPLIIEVQIDIRPGKDKNYINLKSKGRIPVAILTTEAFDAYSVDTSTILFGKTGMECEPIRISYRDINKDNNEDLLLYFKIQETGIQVGDNMAYLTGKVLSGEDIMGSDSILTEKIK